MIENVERSEEWRGHREKERMAADNRRDCDENSEKRHEIKARKIQENGVYHGYGQDTSLYCVILHHLPDLACTDTEVDIRSAYSIG